MGDPKNKDELSAKADHCLFELLHNHPDDVDMNACADLINALVAERAKPLKSKPNEFDMAELFNAIEWRGDAYISFDDHSEALDRFGRCSSALHEARARIGLLEREISQIRLTSATPKSEAR